MLKFEEIFVALGLALFAIFGSCVKWLKSHDQFRMLPFFAEVSGAAFCGVLIYCLYRAGVLGKDISVYAVFAASGVAGLYGSKGIDFLCSLALKTAGLEKLHPQLDRRKGPDRRKALRQEEE